MAEAKSSPALVCVASQQARPHSVPWVNPDQV